MKTLPLLLNFALVAPCVTAIADAEVPDEDPAIVCTARPIYNDGEMRVIQLMDENTIRFEYSNKTLWTVEKAKKGCRPGDVLISIKAGVETMCKPWPNADYAPVRTRSFPEEAESEMLIVDITELKDGVYHIGQEWDNYISITGPEKAVFYRYYPRTANAAEEQLIQAVMNNNLPQVTELLKSGVNPDTATLPDIESPLYLAIGEKSNAECDGTHLRTQYRAGQTELAKVLLDAGANPDLPSTIQLHTPLMEAARTGDIALAELLLEKGADLHAVSSTGMTALHFAAAEGSAEMVQLLLRNGAHPNIATTDAPFLNIECAKGVTPLHLAASAGNAKAMEYLLAAGAYINTPDAEGNTPYFYACTEFDGTCVHLLQAAGADKKHRNKRGNTAELEAYYKWKYRPPFFVISKHR